MIDLNKHWYSGYPSLPPSAFEEREIEEFEPEEEDEREYLRYETLMDELYEKRRDEHD